MTVFYYNTAAVILLKKERAYCLSTAYKTIGLQTRQTDHITPIIYHNNEGPAFVRKAVLVVLPVFITITVSACLICSISDSIEMGL